MAQSNNHDLDDILRAGLTSVMSERIRRDQIANNKTPTETENYLNMFLASAHGKEILKQQLSESRNQLNNEPILNAVNKSGGWFKGIMINLISGVIGALLGPIIWGFTVYYFALGQNNSALPDTMTKNLISKIDNTGKKEPSTVLDKKPEHK